jgi:predicted PurR-regulated permease PerM
MKIEFNKKYTTIAFYIVVVIFLAFAIYTGFNNGSITTLFQSLLNGLLYIIGGMIIFYIIKPLFLLFDLKVFNFLAKKHKYVLKRTFSSITTLIIFLGFMYLIFIIFVPKVFDNITLLNSNITLYISSLKTKISSSPPGLIPWISNSVNKILLNFADQLSSIIKSILPEISLIIEEIVKFVYGMIFSIIFCFIYMFRYEEREAEFLMLVNIIFKGRFAKRLTDFTHIFYEKYLSFYSIIVAYSLAYSIVIFLLLTILRIKFSFLLSSIVLLSSLIPRIGQILAFIITVPLVFIIDIPSGIIYSVIFVALIVLNYIFVYPRIFKNIKLSSEFVLIAIVIASGLFGLFGLFFSVPILSFLYSLLMDKIEKINKNKASKKEIEQNNNNEN